MDIDPETGAMKRMSGDTRTNPYDLFALETAISLREKLGGTVTVLTMGPPQAETMMRDAYACGADDAVIHSVLLYIADREERKKPGIGQNAKGKGTGTCAGVKNIPRGGL